MLLFCPECQSAFTGVSRCPRCGGLLLMPNEAPPSVGEPGRVPVELYKPTPSGRTVVGTIIALGVYLGLRKLTQGTVLAVADQAWWQSADALTTVFILQVIATVFGALLCSAGRTGGIASGALVGLLCGGAFFAAEVAEGMPGLQLALLLQPVLLIVCGAIAGAAGSWVWSAVPELDMPAPLVKKSSSIELLQDAPKETPRPTRWLRVLLGMLVIVAGLGLAEKARFAAEKASRGTLKVESRGQGKFMSWQIATLAVLLGGTLAGANTGAGLRHGILAGILGGLGGGALAIFRGEFSQPEEYLLNYMNIPIGSPQDPLAIFGLGFGVVVAAMVGGWFGGQLLPPLAPTHMRKHHLRGLD